MHTFGTDFLPIQPMLAPISIVDVFFPGFSAVAASAQQLLVGDVNSYVRLLYMGAVFVVFVRYAFGYAKDLINKYFSPTIHISYYDEVHDMVLHWVQCQPFAKKADSLMVRVRAQQRTFVQDQPMKKKTLYYSPWDGSFPFWYKGHLLIFHCRVKDHHEKISISCVGRSSDILFDLMEECRMQYLDLIQKRIPVFQPVAGEWKVAGLRPARDISTVIMDEQVKRDVLKDMKEFLDERTQAWYAAHGILYKRGYLLHGPPGTGKSSFCVAIAGLFELDIYTLSLSSLTDSGLIKLFADLPPRCIVVFEDVDAVGLERKDANVGQKEESKSGVSLSGLLNVLDGISSQEGRILIMTTNDFDSLDKALTRPGRVDQQVYFQRADKDIIAQLFRTIFKHTPSKHGQPGIEIDDGVVERLAEEFAAKVPEDEFSPAQVLSFFLENKNSPADAVDGVQEWVAKQKKAKGPKTELERENSWVKDD